MADERGGATNEPFPGATEGRKTVEAMASELGVTVKEMLAVCAVAGLGVLKPDSELGPSELRRIQDVLAGKAPLGKVKRRSPSGPIITWGRVALVLGVILVGTVGVLGYQFWNRETRIDVRAGDCFKSPGLTTPSGEFLSLASSIDPVPCSEPHDYKAFASINLNETYDSFPGQEALEEHAQERCLALAESTGQTSMSIAFFGPSNEKAWESEAARYLICAVSD